MNKPMRHLRITGMVAAAVGGALLVGGGPAMAASPQQPGGHTDRPATVTTSAPQAHSPASHRRVDPWVLDQLRQFDPAAAQRLAVYDPWVKDQLTQFAAQGH
ncbi:MULTISPECIES: hypothetical protein [Streptomyces]|uniref:Uncharacterized protein n=1 Tax=Streptomyces lienomycini TaxID=284035 RepID=A0ABV9WJL1_9ACTN|nr:MULTISPECIES: hypothetical protein [Streptomyces]